MIDKRRLGVDEGPGGVVDIGEIDPVAVFADYPQAAGLRPVDEFLHRQQVAGADDEMRPESDGREAGTVRGKHHPLAGFAFRSA